jgi:predicted AlkP superfamily phosphohydrolase/phosphomutase
MRTNRNRVVILALDSCDIALARRWAAEGHMPCFRRLFERAAWGLTKNPAGIETGSVWDTVATGVMPDFHGHFDVMNVFDTERYEKRVMRREERGVAPFWVTASEAGRRVAVIDFPYAFLEASLNGIQIADWLTHVRVGPATPTTLPASLGAAVTARYGVNPFASPNRCPGDHVSLESAADYAAFRDKLIDRGRRKLALSLDLMAQEAWDLFITSFHDVHDVGHRCWHIHDARHERHDPALAAALGNPIRDVYAALDAAVGTLIEAAGDATVLVYLSHGMGPERTGTGLLNDILVALDQADQTIPPTRVDRLARVCRALVPAPMRRLLSRGRLARRVYEAHVVERRPTRRFLEVDPSNTTGGVRINLKGRERHGVVEPGAEYDRICAQLKQALLEIENEDTGKPAIASVTMTSDVYRGPLAHRFPDLLLEWSKAGPIERVHSPRIGHLRRHDRRERTGDHVQKGGAYLVLGPGIEPGFCERRARPVDVAPTIAALLGYSDPRYCGIALPGVTVQRDVASVR